MSRSTRVVMTPNRQAIMAVLREGPVADPLGRAAVKLREKSGLPNSPSAFNATLKALAREGLIKRNISGNNTYRIELTEKGHGLWEEKFGPKEVRYQEIADMRDDILRLLAHHGPIVDKSGRAASIITEALGAVSTQVIPQMRRLHYEMGLIDRDIKGKRTMRIELTEKGKEAAAHLKPWKDAEPVSDIDMLATVTPVEEPEPQPEPEPELEPAAEGVIEMIVEAPQPAPPVVPGGIDYERLAAELLIRTLQVVNETNERPDLKRQILELTGKFRAAQEAQAKAEKELKDLWEEHNKLNERHEELADKYRVSVRNATVWERKCEQLEAAQSNVVMVPLKERINPETQRQLASMMRQSPAVHRAAAVNE